MQRYEPLFQRIEVFNLIQEPLCPGPFQRRLAAVDQRLHLVAQRLEVPAGCRLCGHQGQTQFCVPQRFVKIWLSGCLPASARPVRNDLPYAPQQACSLAGYKTVRGGRLARFVQLRGGRDLIFGQAYWGLRRCSFLRRQRFLQIAVADPAEFAGRWSDAGQCLFVGLLVQTLLGGAQYDHLFPSLKLYLPPVIARVLEMAADPRHDVTVRDFRHATAGRTPQAGGRDQAETGVRWADREPTFAALPHFDLRPRFQLIRRVERISGTAAHGSTARANRGGVGKSVLGGQWSGADQEQGESGKVRLRHDETPTDERHIGERGCVC